ncbi:MAG: hypothetical protein EZS28_051680 [Streblomastix strix]|uniref:Uncharacterized protein n=1 Tax=Streblomastix strix TaxID=222440 RepID=A0A5J4T4X9_9EUKA|nr:MAG: hypothetical protein EZS28_051680 [Streblomastix strix]
MQLLGFPTNLDKKQMHSFIKQIKVKLGSARTLDPKRITRRYNRGSTAVRSKLGKPMLRDSEGRTREMAKDHRLFHPKQVFESYSFHNGRYDYTQVDNPGQGLHDQDRSRDSIPPHTSRPSISTFSRIPSQQPLLQIQGDVFRCKTRPIGIQQDFETHNEGNKREVANLFYSFQR